MKSRNAPNLQRNFIFQACMNNSQFIKKQRDKQQQNNNNKIRKKLIPTKNLNRPLSLNNLTLTKKIKYDRQNNFSPQIQKNLKYDSTDNNNFDHYLLSKSSHVQRKEILSKNDIQNRNLVNSHHYQNNYLMSSQHSRKSRYSGNKIKIFSNQHKDIPDIRGKSISRQSVGSLNSKQKRGIQVTKTLLKKISSMYTDKQFDRGGNYSNNRSLSYQRQILQKKKRGQKQQLQNNQTGFMMTTWDSQRTAQQYQLSKDYDSSRAYYREHNLTGYQNDYGSKQNNFRNNNILNGLNASYQTTNYQNINNLNHTDSSSNYYQTINSNQSLNSNQSVNKISAITSPNISNRMSKQNIKKMPIHSNNFKLNNNKFHKQLPAEYVSRDSSQRGSTNSISDFIVKNKHNPNLNNNSNAQNMGINQHHKLKWQEHELYDNIYTHNDSTHDNYYQKNNGHVIQDYQQTLNYNQNQGFQNSQGNQRNHNGQNVQNNRPSYHLSTRQGQVRKSQLNLKSQSKGNKMLSYKNNESRLIKQSQQKKQEYLSQKVQKNSKSIVFNKSKQGIKVDPQYVSTKSPLFETAHEILSQQVSSIKNPYFHSHRQIKGQQLTNYLYGNRSSSDLRKQRQQLQKMSQQQREKYIVRYKNKTFDDLSVKQSLVQGYDGYYS